MKSPFFDRFFVVFLSFLTLFSKEIVVFYRFFSSFNRARTSFSLLNRFSLFVLWPESEVGSASDNVSGVRWFESQRFKSQLTITT